MVKRKMLAADEGLAKQLAKIAEESGQTLYSLVNDALKQTVRAHDLGLNLERVVDNKRVIEMQRASGAVLIPRDALYWLIENMNPEGKKALQERWRQAGRWFGKYLTAKLSGEETLKMFIKTLEGTMWDLDEVVMEDKEETVTVTLMSLTSPEENNQLLMEYVEGAMESLGYQIENKELMRGMTTIRAKPHDS